MSQYDQVVRTGLKLKTNSKISKKKKKSRNEESLSRQAASTMTTSSKTAVVLGGTSKEKAGGSGDTSRDRESTGPIYQDNRTRAEIVFEERREQKLMDRLLNKAEKSHKERIMDLNNHLGNLSEHFDIQKVSWTK